MIDYTKIAKAGDILAVRGTGFLSKGILRLTGNTVSHVGLVISDNPVVLVLEALNRVKTDTIEESLKDVENAYLFRPLNVDETDINTIIRAASKASTNSYGWFSLGLQLADILFRTRLFTDHIYNDRHPICSYLVAEAYGAAGLTFGKLLYQSITPADIFNFAKINSDKYQCIPLALRGIIIPPRIK